MIGFAFGFLGSEGTGETRRLKHTSHMLAVVPDARFKGLGADIKWFQRIEALKQGLDLMTWTYDPLQALNAHLNLNRLGAIAQRYYRNAYGNMTDALNVGLASDRFEAEWHLKSPRVVGRLAGGSRSELPKAGTPVYRIEWDEMGLPVVVEEAPFGDDVNLVEIPADINALKAKNLPLAIHWREQTRSTFERAFTQGYAASGLLKRTDEHGRTRAWYVLRRTED
jgi:predicted GNAT superfamily acetyltransferase